MTPNDADFEQFAVDCATLAALPPVPDHLAAFCARAGLWHLEPLLARLTEARDEIVRLRGLHHPEVAELEARRRVCRMAVDARRAEVWPPDAA